MKALVITPAYSHAHHQVHAAIGASGLPWLPLYERSDLPRTRSVLVSRALELGAEVVVFVDADTVPAPGALEALVAAVQPGRAVLGVYELRDGRLSVEPEPGSADAAAAALARREPFAAEWGGLGLAAVHAEDLRRVGEALPLIRDPDVTWRPYCVPFVHNGRYYADDKSLCARLRDAGTALVADPAIVGLHAIARLVAPQLSPGCAGIDSSQQNAGSGLPPSGSPHV
jgi:hypothetical protein